MAASRRIPRTNQSPVKITPPKNELTLTVIKADCGSMGGHTQPSSGMLRLVDDYIAIRPWVLDYKITHTGDDIAIITTHKEGSGSSQVHKDCRNAFDIAAAKASKEGLYGAGQDLFPTSPSGNVRGTGPGVAEITFELLPKHRPAESIAIFAADKCGPGAYNQALYQGFADPSRSSGFLLAPDISKGFTFIIEDMDHKVSKGAAATHRKIRLNSPEDNVAILALLRNIDRYGVAEIKSRVFPDETSVAVSTDRLHNITGIYQGKDDPVMIIRNQKIFPALEEVIDPFRLVSLVTGDARGSHTMPLMPVAINTPVAGSYCVPLVTCLAVSVNAEGKFSEFVDIFANVAWDRYRGLASEKADLMRSQAPFGVGMASQEEISYTGLKILQDELEKKFALEREVTRK